MELARKYPDALLVYTGGSSSLLRQQYKAADVAKDHYTTHGPEPEKVMYERSARNTWENAKNSLELVEPKLKTPWVLVTSAFHMPRAVGVFCRVGWPVIAYPVDYKTPPALQIRPGFNLADNIIDLDQAIHEWLGLLAYRLSGKTANIFPDSC